MTSKPGSSEERGESFIERLHRGLIGDASAASEDRDETASRPPADAPDSDETATSAPDMDGSSDSEPSDESEADGISFAFEDDAAPEPSQRRKVGADEDDEPDDPDEASAPDGDDTWQQLAEDEADRDHAPTDPVGAVSDGPVTASTRSAVAATVSESVAETLAAELTAGRVDDGTKEVLESHLGVGVDTAVSAQIKRLNDRILALETYADVLETELAGSVADEQLATRVADMDDRVDRLERSMREAMVTVSEGVDRVDGEVRSVDAKVDETRRAVTELQGWQRKLADSMATAARVTPDEPSE
ncbi:hypothetical protein [Haloarchaeobius sp. HME9146]|uniref:hypothetical protein n=1 Tax=Haloarchaeobius sp. HME9146 TaxID=2978732 RepID=UPI0021BE5377|nr:hypothetical protein [Haloarchaeobius sp. HME9146]MCT9098383.1 hypothetical protein [Haloarchaeobius sp. HME9146]